MTRRSLGVLALGLAALSACAGNPGSDTPAAVDPVGFYDFTATRGGDSRPGTLEITRTAAGLDAEAWLTGEPNPALADSVRVVGSNVAIYTLVGGGDVVDLHLQFVGNRSFSGVIIAGPDTIGIVGQRRTQ